MASAFIAASLRVPRVLCNYSYQAQQAWTSFANGTVIGVLLLWLIVTQSRTLLSALQESVCHGNSGVLWIASEQTKDIVAPATSCRAWLIATCAHVVPLRQCLTQWPFIAIRGKNRIRIRWTKGNNLQHQQQQWDCLWGNRIRILI